MVSTPLLELSPCVMVIGPTASGKSDCAHQLIEKLRKVHIRASCVNLDPFQIYQELDKGTSKPSVPERNRYDYHLIDYVGPLDSMDAVQMVVEARRVCAQLWDRGIVPVVVGGSGLYVSSFLGRMDPLPSRCQELRDWFRLCAQEWGWPHLHDWLKALDPQRALQVHPNDGVRIERALECWWLTGKQAHEYQQGGPFGDRLIDSCYLIKLDASSDILKNRITQRTCEYLNSGWVQEVRDLSQKWGEKWTLSQSFRSIGYESILNHILKQDLQSIPEPPSSSSFGDDHPLVQQISTSTWQYARRQNTWFAKVPAHLNLGWLEATLFQRGRFLEPVLEWVQTRRLSFE